MHKLAGLCAIIVFSAVSGTVAQAVTFDFSLTGSRNASFSIDTDKPPSSTSVTPFGSQIFYDGVSGTYDGTPGVGDIIFGQGPIFSDFQITGTPLGFTQFSGADVFTGPADDPIFNLGTLNLTSLVSGRSVLTVTEEAAAVPEPASALLLVGFAAMGGAMRARRQLPIAAARRRIADVPGRRAANASIPIVVRNKRPTPRPRRQRRSARRGRECGGKRDGPRR